MALLGREYKKTAPNFWSNKLNAKVFVMEHPSFFLKGGSAQRLHEWRIRLKNAVHSTKSKGQFAYLEAQDYKLVRSTEAANKAALIACKYALQRKQPVSVDIEYGWLDENGQPCDNGKGRQAILVVGICWKPGVSRVFVIDHPGHTHTKASRKGVLKALATILEDPKVKLVFHHGTADTVPIEKLLNIKVKGYNFDTNYSTYLKWPQMKKFGLDEMSNVKVPDFAGYKAIITPHLNPDNVNYATIPLKVMRLYNGADCDLTKRLQIMTADKAGPLLRTYKDVAYILADMQTRGPYFDKKYYDEVVYLVPKRLESVKNQLLDIAATPDINLNAPQQVAAVIYDKLNFKPVEGEGARSTSAAVLRVLSQDKKKGQFPTLLTEYRKLVKMEGTYLSNYRESAAKHNGQLRTMWWLTGTITGRLRSGGGKDSTATGIVNFQNLHGEPLLQNLLISDPKWRRVLPLHAGLSPSEFNAAWQKRQAKIMPLQLFLALDYGQIEIRMAAEMSGDPALLAAVESGDIHSAVGHELTGWPIEKIKHDKRARTLVKNLHFGILYGMSKGSLYSFLTGLGTDIERSYSDELHSKYFRKYKKVKELIEHLQAFGEKNHYVETMFGFRRPINTGAEFEDERETYWGNQAINSPIQGSAHQLMLFAMATLKQRPKEFSKLSTPVMEVHDAFDFYTSVEDLPYAYLEAKRLLEVAVPEYVKKNYGKTLRVPLVAEGSAGFRLGVMVDYLEGMKRKEFLKSWLQKNHEVESKVQEKWAKAA
jgi:DNA polymerase-1